MKTSTTSELEANLDPKSKVLIGPGSGIYW